MNLMLGNYVKEIGVAIKGISFTFVKFFFAKIVLL
jgi:hypothetical protein